jgi:uncharacterized protein (TIGR00251 family)
LNQKAVSECGGIGVLGWKRNAVHTDTLKLPHPDTDCRHLMIRLTSQPDGITFAVKVVPGASRDKIAGEYDGGLKVTVARPPQDGAANAAVIALLAKQLGISKDQIQITRGHTNPRKTVKVTGLSIEDLQTRLNAK